MMDWDDPATPLPLEWEYTDSGSWFPSSSGWTALVTEAKGVVCRAVIAEVDGDYYMGVQLENVKAGLTKTRFLKQTSDLKLARQALEEVCSQAMDIIIGTTLAEWTDNE